MSDINIVNDTPFEDLLIFDYNNNLKYLQILNTFLDPHETVDMRIHSLRCLFFYENYETPQIREYERTSELLMLSKQQNLFHILNLHLKWRGLSAFFCGLRNGSAVTPLFMVDSGWEEIDYKILKARLQEDEDYNYYGVHWNEILHETAIPAFALDKWLEEGSAPKIIQDLNLIPVLMRHYDY